MFRCCLPCRGGPQQAPATSSPNSPESAENFSSLHVGSASSSGVGVSGSSSNNGSTSSDDRLVSVTSASIRYESQTSPLPHIEEEEELDAGHHTLPGDCTSLSEQLIASQKSIRIVEQHPSSPSQTSLKQTTNNNSRSNQTNNRDSIDDTTSNVASATTAIVSTSSSPRSKHSRKQTKGRNKSIISTTSNDTTATSGGLVSCNQISASGSAATTGSHPVSCLLLPKMQAEQGSIGDLQKYHSRYLKNRRHTLANVR